MPEKVVEKKPVLGSFSLFYADLPPDKVMASILNGKGPSTLEPGKEFPFHDL
jgi:hypothetical protein